MREEEANSTGEQIGFALINVLIVICVVICLTMVLVMLYKYRCYMVGDACAPDCVMSLPYESLAMRAMCNPLLFFLTRALPRRDCRRSTFGCSLSPSCCCSSYPGFTPTTSSTRTFAALVRPVRGSTQANRSSLRAAFFFSPHSQRCPSRAISRAHVRACVRAYMRSRCAAPEPCSSTLRVSAPCRHNVTIDWITFCFILWNWGVAGIMAIHWKVRQLRPTIRLVERRISFAATLPKRRGHVVRLRLRVAHRG